MSTIKQIRVGRDGSLLDIESKNDNGFSERLTSIETLFNALKNEWDAFKVAQPEFFIPKTITVEGVTYYKTEPEDPNDGRILATVEQNGTTYYAYVAPETITVEGITYSKTKPEDPNDGRVIATITRYETTYYAYVAPEFVEVDGVTYYKTKPEDPNDGRVIATIARYEITYYAYVAPEFVEVDGVTYYKTQSQKPGENYEETTIERYGITYYAWIEIIEPFVSVKYNFTSYGDENGETEYATGTVQTVENVTIDSIEYVKVHVLENTVTSFEGLDFLIASNAEVGDTLYQLYDTTGVEQNIWVRITGLTEESEQEQFVPITYSFTSYADENTETAWATGKVQTTGNTTMIEIENQNVEFSEAIVTENTIDGWVGEKFYIVSNAETNGTTRYQLYSIQTETPLEIWVTITAE